jgi:Flp pilus assembly protein TadB
VPKTRGRRDKRQSEASQGLYPRFLLFDCCSWFLVVLLAVLLVMLLDVFLSVCVAGCWLSIACAWCHFSPEIRLVDRFVR